MPFEELIKRFLLSEKSQGLAEKTLATYQQHFSAIGRHFDMSFQIDDLDKNELEEMIAHMRDSTQLIIPINNLMIINNHSIDNIVNLSKRMSTCCLEIRIPSEIPLHQIEEMLRRELPALKEKNELILGGPIYGGVTEMGSAKSFGKPSTTLQIKADCLEKDFTDVKLYLNREVALIFERENIKIL